MDGKELKRICVRSCSDMYTQMEVMQESAESSNNNVSTVINDINAKTYRNGYWEIKLNKRIQDIDRVGMCIVGDDDKVIKGYGTNDVRFDEYDEFSMTVRAFVSDELNEQLANKETKYVKIISDMKWLINLTKEMFEEYGDKIGYPKYSPQFSHDDYDFPHYPRGQKPTDQQRTAVHTILNSSMSYVWGAPGTGKTQFVLSTAIIAHIKKGHRVAIIAPTNNSLEQVLRGVMNVITTDDPEKKYIDPDKDIIRLGIPTHSFMKKYKNICENKAISKEIESVKKTLRILDQVQLASTVDFIIKSLQSIKNDIRDRSQLRDSYLVDEKNDDIDAMLDSIREMLSKYDSFNHLLDEVSHINIDQKIDYIEKEMYIVDKSRLNNDVYSKMSDQDIEEKRSEFMEELDRLERQETNNRIKTVKIMAMTPYVLMSRRRTLFDEDGIVDVDQIFIDEVGYCNLVQSLPVFMCGPPVAMLGDHMQLPPVCELEREMLESFYKEPNPDGYMKNGFMWDQSALNIESYLSGTIEECARIYLNDEDPKFIKIAKCDLTQSHRFSDNLASILDDCVYKNGIKGIGTDPIEIQCIDAVHNRARIERGNSTEADAISRFIEKNGEDLGTFAILTPYRKQKTMLEMRCPATYKDNIMTIHSSQGREWDTIILSVCDDDGVSRDIQLRFTSSVEKDCVGLRVMNTAVSRAKKKIILVCNHKFWAGRAGKNELLGRLAKEAKVINV